MNVLSSNPLNYKAYHIFFSNLANPLRIEIILSLRNKSKSVNDITEELGVEQSKVSHALASLKKCRIVESRRQGKQIIYSLNKSTIEPMLKLIDKHASRNCKCECCVGKECGGMK
jgi:DNA-binding transcriptional ArsR family regulator